MCNVKNILAAMLLVFAVTIFGNAEAAIVTDKMPLQCYVDHKVTSYDLNSGQAVGWIDAEVDLVRISVIDGNGVARGTHPGRNGTVERLFWARDVFADTNYNNRPAHVSGYHDVYRTSTSGSTIGSVRDEDVTVVADNGNRAQIIYRLNNGTGYKMGWVPSSVGADNGSKSNFQMSDYNLTCPSDHQLRFTGRLWNANNYSEITGVHVYIGGGVGAGGEFIGEFRADRDNHHFDYTMNVPQNRSGSQLVVIYAVNGIDAKELDRRYVNVSPSPGGDFDWPIPGCYRYSFRNNHSCRHYYSGGVASAIDIAAAVGTNIYAPASGVVQNKGVGSGFGNWFEILHDDGTITLYAHLSDYSMVKNGQRVNKGDLIALSGNTGGNTTGPHLHFEMYNPNNSNMRPDIYFKSKGVIGNSSY